MYWGCRKIGCRGCLNLFKGNHPDLEQTSSFMTSWGGGGGGYCHASGGQVYSKGLEQVRSATCSVTTFSSLPDVDFDESCLASILNNGNLYESRILKVCDNHVTLDHTLISFVRSRVIGGEIHLICMQFSLSPQGVPPVQQSDGEGCA